MTFWRVNQPKRVAGHAVRLVLGVLIAAGLPLSAPASPAERPPMLRRDALWHLVHDLCLGDLRLTGSPLPCTIVDLARGYAVVRVGAGHLLLVPTASVAGIEDPSLLGSQSEAYWGYAWRAHDLLRDSRGRAVAPDRVALAVNSAQARTQDQLHIHIACLSPQARGALSALAIAGPGWSRHAVRLDGNWYNVMYVANADLAGVEPFRLMAEGLGIAESDMRNQTLVVAAARQRDGSAGFYLLNRASGARDPATGEQLLDASCTAD